MCDPISLGAAAGYILGPALTSSFIAPVIGAGVGGLAGLVAAKKTGITSLLGGGTPDMPDMPNPTAQPRAQTANRRQDTAAARGFGLSATPTYLTGGRGQTADDSLLGNTSLLGG